MVLFCGEIIFKANVNYQRVIRNSIKHVGNDDSSKDFDFKIYLVMFVTDQQSSNIAACVLINKPVEEVNTGDL